MPCPTSGGRSVPSPRLVQQPPRVRALGIALERFLEGLARGGGSSARNLRARDREPRLRELRVGARGLPVVRDRLFEVSTGQLEVAAHEKGIRRRPRLVYRSERGPRLGRAALSDVEGREVLMERG